MSAPLDCPGIECWHALFDDAVSPDQRGTLSSATWNRARSVRSAGPRRGNGEDALLTLVRQVGDPTLAPIDPTLAHVLERLHEASGRGLADAEEPADLYFLRPSDRPDLLGILGDYEVSEVIGQGGMGVVLKAFDPALHRLVAIKVLAAAVAGSATARRRFTREAQAAAAVCHDHIVAVHGVHEADGLPYLVMQYVAGESLQDAARPHRAAGDGGNRPDRPADGIGPGGRSRPGTRSTGTSSRPICCCQRRRRPSAGWDGWVADVPSVP